MTKAYTALFALALTWAVAMVELGPDPTAPPSVVGASSARGQLVRVTGFVEEHQQAAPAHARQPAASRPQAPELNVRRASTRAADRGADPDEVSNDDAMRNSDHSPEQRAWRKAWSTERQDAQWAQQIAAQLRANTQSFLRGSLALSDLDCRETVCRMELQFADQRDAQALMSAPRDPALKYEYQSTDAESHTYELLIKRPELAYLPPEPATEHTEQRDSAGEITILTP